MASLKGEHGHVTEVVSLMEREWSCYGGGQFNGGIMIMLEVVSFMEGEITSLKEGEWSCYRGCHFNGGRRSSEGQRWSV